MAKILSKSGDSLADNYDVAGSVAGIDQLNSEDVNLVHEMGGQLVSERMGARVLVIPSGLIAQSTAFITNFFTGNGITRILAIQVVTNGIGGLANLAVSVTTPVGVTSTDVPLFGWDSTGGLAVAIQVLINNTLATLSMLTPEAAIQVPQIMMGQNQAEPVSTLTMRGLTNAFGGGTIETTALIYTASPNVGGLSSRGLPMPSW